MISELGISQETFLLVAERGLDDDHDKKYFEQVIKTDDYVYFKELMVKRNTQLEQEALALLITKQRKELKKTGNNEKQEYELAKRLNELENSELSKKRLAVIQREIAEIEIALALSREVADEERRRREMEEIEYQVRDIYNLIIKI